MTTHAAEGTAGIWAQPGDRLVIHRHALGEPQRDAEVIEALGDGGTPPFRVRWDDDGHEALIFPGSDASVEHFSHDVPARADADSG